MKYLLGYDIGSSSIKGALLNAETGVCLASAFSPAEEMAISAPQSGWAEQDPEQWWKEAITVTDLLRKQHDFHADDVVSIGISYQMHGLVCLDKDGKVLRPAIIWCDSRAVPYGQEAFKELGEAFCLDHYLNSPGNFTAAKLKWVKENEPDIFEKIHKVMLPGDYIAYRLTGEMTTTVSGLSEGIWWDFREQNIAVDLCRYFGYGQQLLSLIVPTFGEQGRVTKEAAGILKLNEGTPVTYRAGDQPNNAYSLNVLRPGDIAATAGTSGVVYGVNEVASHDPASRVNTFVHVNHTAQSPRNGVLLCVNGTGILYSWIKRNLGIGSYEEMNSLAAGIVPGSDGLLFYPFGNGAERILENRNVGAQMSGLDLNVHQRGHLLRAAQEGIVYALQYGIEIMQEMGVAVKTVKAGYANMFLSPVFREIFAGTTGTVIELYETDGAQGAARAAGVGAGYYASYEESFTGIRKIATIEPEPSLQTQYSMYYARWREQLQRLIS